MKRQQVVFFFVALILFCLVVIDIYWWIEITTDSSKSLEQMKIEYHEKLPRFLGKRHYVAMFNILLMVIAGVLFYKSRSIKGLKTISLIFFAFCNVIGVWMLFSML